MSKTYSVDERALEYVEGMYGRISVPDAVKDSRLHEATYRLQLAGLIPQELIPVEYQLR